MPGHVLPTGERQLYRAVLRANRKLGMSSSEILHLTLTRSLATIKRDTNDARGPRQGRARKTLTTAEKQALTTWYVRAIARGRRVSPASERWRLLEVLCPVHLTRRLNERGRAVTPAHARPDEVREMIETIERHGGSLAAIASDPAELLRFSRRACELDAPVCFTAPAMLAVWVTILRLDGHDVDAFVVAKFVELEVSPDGWWLRSCPKCGLESATESKSHRFCKRCRGRRQAEEPHAPIAAIRARPAPST